MNDSFKNAVRGLSRALNALRGQGHGSIGDPNHKPGCPLCSAAELITQSFYYLTDSAPAQAREEEALLELPRYNPRPAYGTNALPDMRPDPQYGQWVRWSELQVALAALRARLASSAQSSAQGEEAAYNHAEVFHRRLVAAQEAIKDFPVVVTELVRGYGIDVNEKQIDTWLRDALNRKTEARAALADEVKPHA